MKLSIIIPYYNTKEYTDELLKVLDKQVTEEVEVILVDDGSKEPYKTDYKWLTLIRKTNGGVSSARNRALKIAKGNYIAFVDSDDLVSDDYISTILEKTKSNFDYLYISWESFGGWNYTKVLKDNSDKFDSWNLCCWNRIYKKDVIKGIKFNEEKLISEDAEFIREVEKQNLKKDFTSKILYKYRSNTPNSLTKRFGKGELDTKRTVFNYKHITEDMSWLISKAKELNKHGEVIILTEQNDLPCLEEYAMVMKPIRKIKCTEFYGEPTNLVEIFKKPIKAQVVMYTGKLYRIGGIESFMYYWCLGLKDKYDILILYDDIENEQLRRLKETVRVFKNDNKTNIQCDTLIINRYTDIAPQNVSYKKVIQMVHSCKIGQVRIPNVDGLIVPVSQAVVNSFKNELQNKEVKVINNICYLPNKPLKLISLTRATHEKGIDRIIQLANQLNSENIPFSWLVFTEGKLPQIKGLIKADTNIMATSYIQDADYLVQLSDSEAWCLSVEEALMNGVPVITTPLEALKEVGVIDGVNGYIVPFDMNGIDVHKINNNRLKFNYTNNNDKIVNEWCEVLGEQKPFDKYIYEGDKDMKVKVLTKYTDVVIGKELQVGEIVTMKKERVDELLLNPHNLIEVVEYDAPVVEIAKPVVDKVEKAVVKPTVKRTTKKAK